MTVHSKDGIKQGTKLERIGQKALDVETVFNNIAHAIDLESLRDSYQSLDGKKAIGIDGVTKFGYGGNLEGNLNDLLQRIRQHAYKPNASRLVEIPKEDGSTRPLAISCFEDKIVQLCVSKILETIYEPIFLRCSYGYRANKSCHEALRDLMRHSVFIRNGATVEIDLQKYFNSIPHGILMKMLEKKISDKRFLKLVLKLIRTPLLANGREEPNKLGCPQGSIISPILSNIYLHYVIDEWFDTIKKTHLEDKAEEVRFADDMVFIFRSERDAERFYDVLPKRLLKYGLKLHESKSSLIKSGREAAKLAAKRGERLPVYRFLGFTCYWGQSRNGSWRLKFKSRSDRLTAKLNGLRQYLAENLHESTRKVLKRVIQVLIGWVNYHAITDNQRQVNSFLFVSQRILFKWINRKGGKKKMNWERFYRVLQYARYPKNYKTTSMFRTG